MTRKRYRMFDFQVGLHNNAIADERGQYDSLGEARKSVTDTKGQKSVNGHTIYYQWIIADFGPLRNDGSYNDTGKIVDFDKS